MDNQNYYNSYQNVYQQNQPNPEFEKRARELKTLGIGSIILSILCMCCCAFTGIITGVIGLVKANELQDYFEVLSPQGQQDFLIGKICSIIGISLGWIAFVIGLMIYCD